MPPPDSNADANPRPGGLFETTDWSVVLQAGSQGSRRKDALERLCRIYWRPVYGFIRRLGHDAESAKDLTQSFFAHLLEGEFFASADPDRGRFRSYLCQSCRLFLGNEWQKRVAAKRGGGRSAVPFDTLSIEEENQFATPGDPSREFDRQWTLALLRQALSRLEAEYAQAGDTRTFQQLRPYLTARPEPGDYERLAGELGVSRGSVPVMVHRLAKRYQELIRAEVAATVALRQEIDDELRACLRSLE